MARREVGGDGRLHTLVAAPAATVSLRCADLPRDCDSGELVVLVGERRWFSDRIDDAAPGYRCGLPPGSYRVEFQPESALRSGPFTAGFEVGSADVEVVLRR